MAPADGQHIAALGQTLDDAAPDKSGPAEDRHPMLLHVLSRRATRIIKSSDLRQYRDRYRHPRKHGNDEQK